jgi:cellulose synthase/poly-beta-1,6-N-acetylglucosamine synthase-like glycosyltransferase
MFPSLTLIIPTYNEESVIVRKLQDVSELDYPKDRMEILIVDSASTDKTLDYAKAFVKNMKDEMDIQILTQDERSGKAAALNYALKFCKKKLLVLSDADVLLEKDALTQIVSNFADRTIGAVSGIEVMMNPDYTGTTRAEQGYRSFYNMIRLGETNLDSVIMCESEFSAYRRDLVTELPDASICDDMELTINVRKQGFRAVYDSNARFYEYSPFKPRTRFKHKTRRGQGNQQTLIRHFKLMFNPKYGLFSFVILPFEIFMHLISPILTVICMLTFALSLVFGSVYFVAWFLIPFCLATLATAYAALRFLSPASKVTLERASDKLDLFKVLLMIPDFIMLQIALLWAMTKLVLRRTEYKWEKIEEIRTSPAAC